MKKAEKKKEKKRIKKYVRFIKKNKEWDYQHIIDLLRFKLKMMREFLEKEGHSEEEVIRKQTSQILEVELLLQKVADNKYLNKLHDDFEINYGTTELKFIKIKGSKNYRHEIIWNVPDDKLQEAKEVSAQLMNRADELAKKDLEKAFQLMLENIWDWWD